MKRLLMAALAAVCAAMLCAQAIPGRPAGDRYAATGRTLALPDITMPEGTIPINTADLDELTELPGVGETLGRYIMDERALHGPFHYPEDLMVVRGIGEKTLEGLRDWLDMTVENDEK